MYEKLVFFYTLKNEIDLDILVVAGRVTQHLSQLYAEFTLSDMKPDKHAENVGQ